MKRIISTVALSIVTASTTYAQAGTSVINPTTGLKRMECVPGTDASGIGKLEDSAHSSGDAGVMILGVTGETAANFPDNANGGYGPVRIDRYGNVNTLLTKSIPGGGAGNYAVRAEDSAFATTDALVMSGTQYLSTPAQGADTSGDTSVFATGQTGGLYTQPIAGPTGGATNASAISAATNNATNVKASAGTVYSVTACNINAAVRWVKLFNKASSPTCGSDTPVLRIPAPVNNCVTVSFPVGLNFGTGIGYCIVTGAADADNTSTAANEQTLTIAYN